jgi:hypothetical protein
MYRTGIVSLVLVLTSLGAAQKPHITNARLEEISAASGLQPVVDSIVQKQNTPGWIGYRVPTVARHDMMCCSAGEDGGHCCMGCRPESNQSGSMNNTVSDCSSPEPPHDAFVFLRVEARQIMKVRNYSPNCALDFDGLPVYWLENVNPAQSVDLLVALVLPTDAETDHRKSTANSAIAAIAFHDDPSADQALAKLIQPDHPQSIREHVAFWLAAERGQQGLEVLRKYARDDPSDRLRGKIAFAFSVTKEPDAVKDLILMARNDRSSHVRGQAIFWLAQIGGRQQAQLITEAIENDPETEVKKKAVFALAQMKNGEGVPLLIQVAKTNRNPVVRKEAIRWLGFSKDTRALDFLEQIVSKQVTAP